MVDSADRFNRSRVADPIATDLWHQILDGQLPDGARLPGERGSGDTAAVDGGSPLRMSIASIMELEHMQTGELLELLGVLVVHAAECAVEHATDADIERLRAATERTADLTDSRTGAAALRQFFLVLTECSHNPLLVALTTALVEIQLGMVVELSRRTTPDWSMFATAMYRERVAVAEAIARRDPAALEHARDYHIRLVNVIRTRPDFAAPRGIVPSWLNGESRD